MESSEYQRRSEPLTPSSSESQSEPSSDSQSPPRFEDLSKRPSTILLKTCRVIARLLLGSATVLLVLALVLFALATWLLTVPFKRGSRFQSVLLILAEVAALVRVERTRR